MNLRTQSLLLLSTLFLSHKIEFVKYSINVSKIIYLLLFWYLQFFVLCSPFLSKVFKKISHSFSIWRFYRLVNNCTLCCDLKSCFPQFFLLYQNFVLLSPVYILLFISFPFQTLCYPKNTHRTESMQAAFSTKYQKFWYSFVLKVALKFLSQCRPERPMNQHCILVDNCTFNYMFVF